jgi:hypothetical protein
MILRFDSTALRDAFVAKLERERSVPTARLHAARNRPDLVVEDAAPAEEAELEQLAAEFSGRAYRDVRFAPFDGSERR